VLYSRLKVTAQGPSYIHLPLAHETAAGAYRFGVDEEFVAQLTAEKLVTKHRMGVPHRVWVQTRPRNEGTDLFVYALAALRILRPNLEALAERLGPKTAAAAPALKAPTRPAWVEPRRDWLRGRR
jgi:phage terminase large subunit GpA-like protein